jgi:hypothetical protein
MSKMQKNMATARKKGLVIEKGILSLPSGNVSNLYLSKNNVLSIKK